MEVITNNNIRCTIALAVLQDVTDPEIGLNVVDLGLIYQVDFDETALEIYIAMTLTTQFCPMGASIVTAVKRAMQQAFPDFTVQVNLTFDPPWKHERISAEGQEFLGR